MNFTNEKKFRTREQTAAAMLLQLRKKNSLQGAFILQLKSKVAWRDVIKVCNRVETYWKMEFMKGKRESACSTQRQRCHRRIQA